jgi:hypothetical protein
VNQKKGDDRVADMLSIAKKKMQVSKGVGGLGDAASMMLLLKSKKAEAEKE